MSIFVKPLLWVVLSIFLLLSGCVKYDLGVNFYHSNSGEIVQHIQLDQKLTSFSGDYIHEWWKSLENRAYRLGGSVNKISDAEIIVKLPFTKGQELQDKFNVFFHSPTDKKFPEVTSNKSNSDVNLPGIISKFLVEDHNFGLVSRNHLIYDVDLRSLAPIVTQSNALASTKATTNSVINLDFQLQTPWGIRNIPQTENTIKPQKNGSQSFWQLQLGQINHIEVVFWLPNFLGIGTLLIILFIWGGFYLRYKL